MTKEPKRFTLISDKDLTLDIEYTDFACILHIHEIHGFNRTILRRLVELSDNLADWLIPQYGALFTYAQRDRADLIKLAVHMKYEQFDEDGENIIYRRTRCQH